MELDLAGVPERGSIWDGDLRYDTTIVYLRPNKDFLDAAIARRSEVIVRYGLEEAAELRAMAGAEEGINASVAGSIGVRELLAHLEGELTIEEARDQITARTQKLARRQVRWFDKLITTLHGRTPVHVAESAPDTAAMNYMHDSIGV